MLRNTEKKRRTETVRVPLPVLEGDYTEAIRPYQNDPYQFAALAVEALILYASEPKRSLAQLEVLRSPLRLLPKDTESIRTELANRGWIMRSYLEGAYPDNSYTPDLPYAILCDVNPLTSLDVDILRISVHCNGDPLPRTVSLRRKGNRYYLWDYADLLTQPLHPTQGSVEEKTSEIQTEVSNYEEMIGLKQFPIGCWTYFGMDMVYPELVKDWHELGINNPLTPRFEEGDDKEAMLRLLDECASYGMEVFVSDYRTLWRTLTKQGEPAYRRLAAEAVADFGGHPAVKGFYIGDEPDAPDAADAFKAARICRECAPHLTPYLNLLPWFDWIGERIGSDAYAPYLDRVVKEGRIDLLAYDCYTQMWEGDTGYDVYFNNLREHSEAARRNNVDFCSTLLSIGHFDYRCPSYNDFRWQISTAAAFGAKSIAWFYIHQFGIHANYRRPPINVFRERTPEYQWLSSACREFQLIHGSELMRLNIQDIGFVGKKYGGCDFFKPDEKILGVDNAKGLTLLFNRFTDNAGGQYAVLVNVDTEKSCTANIHLAKHVKLSWRDNFGDYNPVNAFTDAVGQQTWGADASTASLLLAPGQMELLKITVE